MHTDSIEYNMSFYIGGIKNRSFVYCTWLNKMIKKNHVFV